MRNKEPQLYSERVTLRTIILSLGFVLVGIALVWAATGDPWSGRWKVAQVLIEQLGGLLFVTATLTLVWELAAKRAFLEEILVKTQIARDVALSGLLKITNQYLDDINWRRYIESSKEIDIFFAYGRTWRGVHESQLREAIRTNDAKIRVILPDRDDAAVLSELSRRFALTEDEVRIRIDECIRFVAALRAEEMNAGGSIRLWLLRKAPVFSCYRFDHVGILALYKHQDGRGNVPTFVFEQGGVFFDFMRQEFDAMVCTDANLAREVNLDEE